MPENSQKPCFHCGILVPKGFDITVNIDGVDQPMCCYGCQAVAQAIVDSGMDDFYRFRTEKPGKASEVVPEFLQQLKAYDNPVVQKQFVAEQADDSGDIREVSLILEGIVCAACIWLNERHLNALPGVISASINYSNHRARVRWDNNRVSLSQILESISRIGYMAHPYDPDQQQKIIEKERKQQLRRVGIAGVLGMQIMILAVAMYAGEWWGMNENFLQSFRWLSLVITVPLLLFASRPFFAAAWRDIKNRRVGMDVPVSLGMGIAFSASVVHTLQGSGAVYFDSVAMFTFFLLSARYFEMNARKRSAEATETLLNLVPAIATRVVEENAESVHKSVPVVELVAGDKVLVRPGENIPVDGTIIEGTSGVNESLVTGESLPVTKSVDDEVIGGSTNIESPLLIRVDRIGEETVLASIQRLLDDAQHTKPAIAQLADRIASWFVSIILLITTAVAIYWYRIEPEHWVAITIATLVVTCPCALSLATPTAITAASGQLARLGLLPTRPLALETLARASDFVFDKTGTLTEGNIRLVATRRLSDYSEDALLSIAAALETGSEHPIAKSLLQEAGQRKLASPCASDMLNKPGSGISGLVNGQRWYLGNPNFINAECESALDASHIDDPQLKDMTLVALATRERVHVLFAFDDTLRSEAVSLVEDLKRAGKNISLMTGDHATTAHRVAEQVGIENVHADLRPGDKLARVRQLQQQGAIVAMTGDGINDAPVLAAADVSIAMGTGTQLAAAHADMILLSNHIEHLYNGYRIATRTLHIIRQNLGWALAYNLVAVPAAAAGYVDPWLAAIGMSASSLIVVINALRLTKS